MSVFNRLRSIFRRYVHHHMSLDSQSLPIHDLDGNQVAYIDRMMLRNGSLYVEGWSTASQIRLQSASGVAVSRPDLLRRDVAEAYSVDAQVGFHLTQPFGDGEFIFHVLQDAAVPGAQVSQVLVPFPRAQRRRERARLLATFTRQLLRAIPAVMRWFATHDPSARARIKALLGMSSSTAAHLLEHRIFAEEGDLVSDRASWPGPPHITIVLPVYNAFDILQKCLDRVEKHTELPWRMVLIEDGSTDARVRPFLRQWMAARADRVELIENAQNMGFIAAVNLGLDRAIELGDHVVLLNSDGLVPRLWAHRLLRPLQVHKDVASVTPMSNDAEILSVPTICKGSVLRDGQADAIDAVAARFNPEATLSVLPTGVGFCMALHIDWLRAVPQLDEIFGRGYGEEVDWCQRVRALGGRHLGVPGLFVEHRGGESFGQAEKERLIARNGQIITSRYPRYDQEVQDFIASDPLVTARLILAVTWAASEAANQGSPLPIYMAHSLGGGADSYLERRIAKDLAERALPSIVLRVGGENNLEGTPNRKNCRWQIEVVSAHGRVSGFTDDFDFVRRMLALVGDGALTYSCGVGDADPVTLPAALLDLMREPDTLRSLDILVHDYFMISPSYTLLNKDGVYEGPVIASAAPIGADNTGPVWAGSVPSAARLAREVLGGASSRADIQRADIQDAAHQTTRPDGTPVSIFEWQRAWGELMAVADTVTVFSQSSQELIRASYPAAAGRIRVIPHELHSDIARIKRPERAERDPTPPRVVAVLGNIGFQKGAALLGDLSRLMAAQQNPIKLIVIGNVDPAYPAPKAVHVHGSYQIKELPALAAQYGITDWLIPSIWPETFCYTVHEALATGLPTYAFDIGAQGEAVRAAENGWPVAFDAASHHDRGSGVGDNYGSLAKNLIKVMTDDHEKRHPRTAK